MKMTIEEIRNLNNERHIIITEHADTRMRSRGISRSDIIHGIATGEVIEEYPNAYPFPACLVLGFTQGNRFVHIVVSIGNGFICIVTAYYPDEEKWEPDLSTRR